MAALDVTDLARRYEVTYQAVSAAIRNGRAGRRAPAPAGTKHARNAPDVFDLAEFDHFWYGERVPAGLPDTPDPASLTQLADRYGVSVETIYPASAVSRGPASRQRRRPLPVGKADTSRRRHLYDVAAFDAFWFGADEVHGTEYRYRTVGCRCSQCRRWNTEARRREYVARQYGPGGPLGPESRQTIVEGLRAGAVLAEAAARVGATVTAVYAACDHVPAFRRAVDDLIRK